MHKSLSHLYRKMALLTTAAAVFQTAGCQADVVSLLASLTTSAATNLINSFIFSAFGLAP